MNGDPAGSRTGDVSAQSPRLYYCGSPLHIALPNFHLIDLGIVKTIIDASNYNFNAIYHGF